MLIIGLQYSRYREQHASEIDIANKYGSMLN